MENQISTDTPVIDVPAVSTPSDISLVRGGPFYRAQVKFKLVESKKWNADQTEQDHDKLVKAIKAGKLEAIQGV